MVYISIMYNVHPGLSILLVPREIATLYRVQDPKALSQIGSRLLYEPAFFHQCRHRVNIEWQRPLSGVQYIMMEKLAQ
jgi:hypothetical protein